LKVFGDDGLICVAIRDKLASVHKPGQHFRRWMLFVGTCGLLAGGRDFASGAEPANEPPSYFMRSWQVESGLPQNKVTAAVQTHDSYLWVGTYSGLARFDGVRFTVFDSKNTPAMHSSRVTSLYESADGTLWIGHENGEVTIRKDGQFQPLPIRAGWVRRKIAAITADAAGDVWLLNDVGLIARVRDGLVLSPEAGTAKKLFSLTRTADGTAWVARDGRLSVLDQGRLRTIYPDWPLTNSTYVQGICASRDGGLWVGSNSRIRKWKDGKWAEDLGVAPWAMAPLTGLVETKNGTLVAATANTGFFFLFPGTDKPPQHINRFNGLEVNWITLVMEDRENNLWLGTGGNGLIELRQNHIQTLEPPDRWHGRALLAVYPGRDGEMWIGTEGAGLYRYQNGDWINFGYTNFIGNSYIWSVTEDLAGQLWVGTWGGGLFERAGDHFKFAPGLENLTVPVTALLPARDGGVWVGTSLGLLHYQDGKTNWFTEADGKTVRDVRTIVETTNGIVWFGTAGHGLARLEQGRVRQFGQSNGLPGDYIECLHWDETGALWIGTFDGGLCRLKAGIFFVIDREQGLPNSVIGDIEDDGHGNFWMSSQGGIIRASKAELNNCADGKVNAVRWLTYGINDGMPTIECSEGLQPAGCKTPDGRLWFPTTKGLVVVNPAAVKVNPLPPPMALEEVLIDGERVTNTRSPLIVQPGHYRFEFHYTGLSLVAPEKVQFKYRIEGLEKDWVDAGTKRVANYSFVPPGNYTFHVIACNNDGVWNETGVAQPFTLLPHFWQTWWFRILGGLLTAVAASAVAWFETRRRLRRRLEKLEREQAIERERARIARDIHDDLGASLTRITMLSQSARGESELSATVASNLERIFGTARELTLAMDEIVWAVNPRHDRLDSLANYLSRFAHDFLSTAEIRCRLDMPVQLPSLPVAAEMRHNLFLAYKEALHNAVKHAAATEVRVELKFAADTLTLVVADNGRGLPPGETPGQSPVSANGFPHGNGLANMQRRLAEIGGECTIRCELGRGTDVSFIVPLHG